LSNDNAKIDVLAELLACSNLLVKEFLALLLEVGKMLLYKYCLQFFNITCTIVWLLFSTLITSCDCW